MRKEPLTGLVLGALLALAAPKSGIALPISQNVVGGIPSGENTSKARQQAFEIVWQTVKEKHFDSTFGGLNWDLVRERYAPRVAAAKTDQDLYQLLQQMLGELRQSHFGIIPPEAIIDDDSREPTEGAIGIDLRIIGGLVVITKVSPRSAAARAGLRAGFVLKKIDDTPVEGIINRLGRSKELAAVTRIRMISSILKRVGGKPGTSVRLLYLDGQNRPSEVTVERERPDGEMSPRLGNFPPQYTEFEFRRLENGIGYIRFNIFVIPLMDKIRAAIRSMLNAPGLVIDLRGNPGGIGGMSSGVAGLLGDKQFSLGTMTLRTGHQNFVAFPQKDPYVGPVVILIDGLSASTSEVLAGGMQEIGRAEVIGERSAGAALPSLMTRLPTGALFQYAIADFRTPNGVLIEGRGVIPDIEVKLTRAALLAGRDSQLEAAIRSIQNRRGLRKRAA